MLIMNKKSVIVLPFSFAFNFECTEGLNLEQFLQGRAKVKILHSLYSSVQWNLLTLGFEFYFYACLENKFIFLIGCLVT